MRLLFFIFLFLNAVVFGYGRYADSHAGGAAQLSLLQISPEKMKLLSTGDRVAQPAQSRTTQSTSAQADPSAPVAACLEWGSLSGDDVTRATDALNKLNLGDKLSQRNGEAYWVYVPPAKNKADAVKAAADIKALGLNDVYVMPDNDPLHFAVSLGVFKTEDAAKSYLQQITQKGVRTAVITPRGAKSTVFVVREPGTDVTAKITALKTGFPNTEIKAAACASAATKS